MIKSKFKLNKELVCKMCGISINKAPLYYCKKHKTAFCMDCLYPSRAPKFRESAHCRTVYHLGEFSNTKYHNPGVDDCIHIKITKEDIIT